MAAKQGIKKRGPGGRKKKHPSERRSQKRETRWTIDEEIEVQAKADGAGITFAEFTRRSALNRRIEVRESTADAQLINELNRLGVNLNIYVRDILSQRKDHPAADIKALADKVDRALDRVLEEFAA